MRFRLERKCTRVCALCKFQINFRSKKFCEIQVWVEKLNFLSLWIANDLMNMISISGVLNCNENFNHASTFFVKENNISSNVALEIIASCEQISCQKAQVLSVNFKSLIILVHSSFHVTSDRNEPIHDLHVHFHSYFHQFASYLFEQVWQRIRIISMSNSYY